MSSSPAAPAPCPPEFRKVFRAHADAHGRMTFARFMELALYHPEVGYYRKTRPRVGYGRSTDFFTAASTGPIFGELVSAACSNLLKAAARDPARHHFVELGVEPGSAGILDGVAHPFAGVTPVRFGEPIALTGHCVVFSNELLDAQPCKRSVFRRGEWRELGVELRDDTLHEIELGADPAVGVEAAPDGYCFDQPLAAAELATTIADGPWTGLFVAFDYGKTFHELAHETPAGTVRAYHRHTQSNDLLARPGEQDLTCHVCWDWIVAVLQRHGFATPTLAFQESFFIRHAGDFISQTSVTEAARFSARKVALLQLLHPSQMGQKFQVLHALR